MKKLLLSLLLAGCASAPPLTQPPPTPPKLIILGPPVLLDKDEDVGALLFQYSTWDPWFKATAARSKYADDAWQKCGEPSRRR